MTLARLLPRSPRAIAAPARRASAARRRLLALGLCLLPVLALAAPPHCQRARWLADSVCLAPPAGEAPFERLRADLEQYLETEKAQGRLRDAGLYFHDLAGGQHFGLNEASYFAGGSMLKLPVAMQVLKLAEVSPGVLQQTLRVPPVPRDAYRVHYPPRQRLVPGDRHTIAELLRRTVVYSDNLAFVMLCDFLAAHAGGEAAVRDFYLRVGLVPAVVGGISFISTERYAALLELVYDAAFLDAAQSETLMQLLLASTFERGLVQGLPPGVRVAHKFGEKAIGPDGDPDSMVQLNDCGIVYYPDHPYTLCVMTRGPRYRDLEQVVGTLSRRVYAEVDRQCHAPARPHAPAPH